MREHDGYMDRYTGHRRAAHHRHRPRGAWRGARTAAVSRASSRSARCAGEDPPRFVGFIRDITERKEAEEQLKRSEAELRLAQELANLGNYVVHMHGDEPDYFSAQLYRILGVPIDGEPSRPRGLLRALGARGRPGARDRGLQPHGRERRAARHRVPGVAARRADAAPPPYRAGRAGRERPGHEARRHHSRRHRPAPRRGRSTPAPGPAHAFQPALDDGRDGSGSRARDQPAALRDRHLRPGQPALPEAARAGHRRGRGRARADQHAGAARGRGHPAPAEFRQEPRGQARGGGLQPAARRPADARGNRRPAAQHPPADRRGRRRCRPFTRTRSSSSR